MNNALRQVEVEEISFLQECRYDEIEKKAFLKVLDDFRKDGAILSGYNEPVWICWSGVRQYGLDFRFDRIGYEKRFRGLSGITASQMDDVLRCYVLYVAGEFVFSTIQVRLNAVKEFIVRVGDPEYRISEEIRTVIQDFLFFIGMDVEAAENALRMVKSVRQKASGQRELSHLVNYMAIANEIDLIYGSEPSDEVFIRWFPVWFWVKVTFVIPLRATEMLLTPYECLEDSEDGLRLKLRRTQLKKRTRTVYYSVDRDYGVFSYRIPDNGVPDAIRKYQALTRGRDRKYLFDFSKYSVNRLLSLQAFNGLLAEFVQERLIGNRRYDYARYACGIDEFDLVTAGDSRPIAMANLYFQDVGADVCRELANHVSVNVSAGYYTNVSNTVYASSVMKLQRMLNAEAQRTDLYESEYGRRDAGLIEKAIRSDSLSAVDGGCLSPRRPHSTGDIADCVAEDHISECLGCRYYSPAPERLQADLKERRDRLDEASRKVVEFMADADKLQAKGIDFDKIFLDAHSGIVRYGTACDEKAVEEAVKWRRKRNTTTTCS